MRGDEPEERNPPADGINYRGGYLKWGLGDGLVNPLETVKKLSGEGGRLSHYMNDHSAPGQKIPKFTTGEGCLLVNRFFGRKS